MGVSKTIDMNSEARKTVKELLQRYLPGVAVWAYGSRVKWTARPDSDLDLVVFLGKEQRGDVANLREAFDESDLPFRVDVFIWDEVPEKFREEILEGYVVVREGDKGLLEVVSEDNITRSPEHWRLVTLGEICKESGGDIQTGPFGSQLHASDYVTYGTPSIMPKNIAVEGIDTTDIARISEEDAARLSKYLVRDGDIIYSRRGDVEKCALVTRDEEGWLCGTGCLRIRLGATALISAEFLHAYLSHSSVREWVVRHAVGATMPNLNTSILAALPVPVPSDTEQDTIGSFWRKTIWKIQLNRRMNQTLEAMAQAIFKSWFVDFDPVKAKQGAKAFGIDSERAAMAALSGKLCVPKSPADLSVEDLLKAEAELDQLGEEERKQLAQTAALFPDGFVDSELGLIPEGWETAPLKTYIEITKGRSYKSTELAESTTALVTLKSFQRGGGYREDGLKAFTGQYKPEQKVEPGELIVAFTDVTQAADVIGKPALVRSNPDYDTLVASLDVGIVRPTSHLSLPYLYFILMAPRFQSHAYGHCSGTTVLHLSKTALPSYQTIIPGPQLMKQFDLISQPALDMMEELAKDSRTLARLRDTLLPKLLSGEISLCETEAQTEEALP